MKQRVLVMRKIGCLFLLSSLMITVPLIGQPESISPGLETEQGQQKRYSAYFNLLYGFSTYRSGRHNVIGASVDVKAGIVTPSSLLFGTGISTLTLDSYELGVVLPFETGYRLPNERWDLKAGVGYVFLDLWWQDNTIHPDDLSGRVLSLDAYWRPIVTQRNLRIVIAAGGLMYDLGNSRIFGNFCSICNQESGPRYTFRLRAGIGF